MNEVTEAKLKAAIGQIMAIADAIRELKTVPSGVFYSQICTEISLSAFDSILKILQKQKLVTVENHVITWIGPDKA